LYSDADPADDIIMAAQFMECRQTGNAVASSSIGLHIVQMISLTFVLKLLCDIAIATKFWANQRKLACPSIVLAFHIG